MDIIPNREVIYSLKQTYFAAYSLEIEPNPKVYENSNDFGMAMGK